MHRIKQLGDMLGMRYKKEHNNYLGLATILGPQLNIRFSYLVDRVVKKTQRWNDIKFSKVSKEVLIKSINSNICDESILITQVYLSF